MDVTDRVLAEVEQARDEAVSFTSELIRIPTVNPPGEAYEDCARLIGERLAECEFEIEYYAAEGPRNTPPAIPASTSSAAGADGRRIHSSI